MKRNPSDIHASTLLPVHDEPTPLRLPVGSVIFAYRGEVWITQEGMYDDVILAPGDRFDVRSRALILASATRGHANLYVAHPADTAGSSTGDLFDHLRARARRLRDERLNQALRTIGGLLDGLAALPAQFRRSFRRTKYQPL